jgi:hypothetical protein
METPTWRDAVKATVRACLEEDSCKNQDWLDEMTYTITDEIFDTLGISSNQQDLPCKNTRIIVEMGS